MTPGAPKEVTGRMVLLCLVGFFFVVVGINAVMVRVAVSTFGGVETDSSYKAGLAFAKEAQAAHAQDALNWNVRASVIPRTDRQQIEVVARDAGGRGVSDVTALARLSHPTDRRADLVIDLHETSPGHYVGAAAPTAGQWDLVIDLVRNGERLFRSKGRLMIELR